MHSLIGSTRLPRAVGIIHKLFLTCSAANQSDFDLEMLLSLPLLALLIAQSTAIVLTDPHPNTNLYRDVGGVVASSDVNAHLETALRPRENAPMDESPRHAMTRRQSAQVIEMYGQFDLPCNISAATVATAVKYVIPLTLKTYRIKVNITNLQGKQRYNSLPPILCIYCMHYVHYEGLGVMLSGFANTAR